MPTEWLQVACKPASPASHVPGQPSEQDCDDDGDAGEYDGGADDHDGWGSEPGWARQPAHSDGDDKVLRQEQIELAVPAASMAIDAAAVSRAAGRPPASNAPRRQLACLLYRTW